MSSPTAAPSAPPARGRVRWRLRPSTWTLRSRLLVSLIALLAATTAVIGVISVVAMDRFMIGQLDGQVGTLIKRAGGPRPDHPLPPINSDGLPTFLNEPGIGEGVVGALITGQGVSAGVVECAPGASFCQPKPVPGATETLLASVPRDGQGHSVDLGDLGAYRVSAHPARDGSVIVLGMPLGMVNDTTSAVAGIISIVALIGVVAAALAGAAIVRLALRPMRRLALVAGRVAQLPLDREVALPVRVPERDTDPHTEVGQVGSAFNRMLGHVGNALRVRQASEARMRRFVSDASHELRTPLASIRGYAELTRRAGGTLPPDVAHALRRVESEAVRMTGLVEDLLLLARLDEGRPLVAEPLDLNLLAIDAVGDAHAAGPTHRWELDLPDEPVVVRGDQHRLHQVLANLLANGRTHTPPGTTILVRIRLEGGEPGAQSGARPGAQAVIRVIDNGPGIPEHLLPEVFERFARGDSSRSRAAGSTGLGLSIVASVVEAHHGRVEVASRPGRTEFVVRVPAAPADDAPTDHAPPAGSPTGADDGAAGDARSGNGHAPVPHQPTAGTLPG